MRLVGQNTPKLRVSFQLKAGRGQRYQEITGAAMLFEIESAASAPAMRDRLAAAIRREVEEEKKK